MNITQIESNLEDLINSLDKSEFIYDLLMAYGRAKASITRLKSGNLNLSKVDGEVSWKKQLFFKEENNADLHVTIIDLVKLIKNDQRFVIVTDYESLLAVDTKTLDKLDIKLTDLPKNYDFFLPWAGMEKTHHQDENPADVKAAEKMAKLFDKLKEDNPADSPEFIHGLNVFLSRLLFCFFAEDTNIFTENQFTSSISSYTQPDGSDLQSYLVLLFKVLDTPESSRDGLPGYLNHFPYVNGELFRHDHQIPVFKMKSRQAIIDCGSLDWSNINPDIFGSMFQAVVDTKERGSLGMHYTSVPNIMKVIKPLFLDDLYQNFTRSKGSNKKLSALLIRIHKIKIFDPACGSGNFLIIAYKELRTLEMRIFKAAEKLSFQSNALEALQYEPFSGLKLSNLYGIEIDDFAHEIAKLSLWLTEHQMNIEFFDEFQRVNPTLPLKKAGNITCANATRIDWEDVCPKEQDDEIYVLGNPPYLGSRYQEDVHREDVGFILHKIKDYKRLDYITIWFYKGADYIKGINSKLAFVTTNSITQGEQVVNFWPYVLSDNIEISFAYTSFKWMNNAKGNAGVTVAIIGLQNKTNNQKYLYSNNSVLTAKNINPYLTTANNVFIQKRSTPLSYKEKIERTNPALDNGFFLLNENEKQSLVLGYPQSERLVKLVVGAAEFLRGINKYCLWINDEDLGLAESIPPINERIEKVREYRLQRKNTASKNPADFPHRFLKMKLAKKQVLFLPTVSSERRRYIPVGFLDEDTVIIDPNFAIYDPEIYIMSIVSSRMHMTWVRTIAGRLKTDYRYSSTLVYNTFPFPNISDKQKEELNQHVFNILGEREKHPEKTLAQLYDPDKMPDGLREAHHQNDLAIERCYRSKPFENDEERLEYLFKLYEKMISEEEAK